MYYEFLDFLRCPISKTLLNFELISESITEAPSKEIMEGLLYSETGFIFPIIGGIPRMQVEAMYDFEEFLRKYVQNFDSIKKNLEERHTGLIAYCVKKNTKTKKSFEFEWSFLDQRKKDQIWHTSPQELTNIFLNETGENESFFKNKNVIDIGSGHGIMTAKIAEQSNIVFGIELSKAVEQAYSFNKAKNICFVQADLQFLPFDEQTFDVVYSSGVIHHTNNTELSFSSIEPVLTKGGKICLWLYHPQPSIIHQIILTIRKLTSRLPLKVAYIFILLFIFPITFTIKKIRNKRKLNYREEIIDLLDGLTPEFRDEIPQDVAISWLMKRKYQNIKITTESMFGFSITGDKSI